MCFTCNSTDTERQHDVNLSDWLGQNSTTLKVCHCWQWIVIHIPTCTHTTIKLAGQSDNQTAWDMFLLFHISVSGLVAHPWVARPTGKTPAIPDGTLHLTTNLWNVQIHVSSAYIISTFYVILYNYPFPHIMFRDLKKKAQTNISQRIANLIVACYCCYWCSSLTISSWCSQICSVLM